MVQAGPDKIRDEISIIQDVFRLTDEEIGRFVRHRGSKVKVGGWEHSFYWQGTTEEHNNYGWSEETVLRQVFGYRRGPDIFLSHLVVEGEKGLQVVAPVYAWRQGDTQYNRIMRQVRTDESPIWIRDIQGDTSVYENQTYIERELTRQFEDGLIKYLGSAHSMHVDTRGPFYSIRDSEGRSMIYDFSMDAITQSDTVKFDPAEMLDRITKYLEKIA